MLSMELQKMIKDCIGHTVASTSANSVDSKTLNSTTIGIWSGKMLGDTFDLLIRCTTGTLWIAPGNTTTLLTSANGVKLAENESLALRVKGSLQVVGDSTTAAFDAILWRYQE